MIKEDQKLNIALYIGSWPQNIGNAFFDLGLEAIVKKAFPNANIYYTGGAVHWMFNHPRKIITKTFFGNKIEEKSYIKNSVEIAQFANVDIVVVPGMCLTREFVDNNGKTFLELSKRKIPVFFVGAGALEYTQEESNYYANFLNNFYKYSIITRDDNTFEMLKKSGVKNIEKGIDCAFFLPDRYSPPKLSIDKFNVMNFDSTQEPNTIDHKGVKVFRTHHNCWGPLPENYVNKEDTLVSDVPFDYLALYGNVNETYSDRVHACVATLAYGNKARLFSKTPRASLFKKVGAEKITQELTSVDMKLLQTLKTRQIDLVKKIINELI